MTDWVRLSSKPPYIPESRDYITVTVKLENGQTVIVQYTKRWGWRDANFDKVDDIIEWDRDSIK